MLNEDRLRILFLYDAYSTYTATVNEYLQAFQQYSKQQLFYLHAGHDAKSAVDFDAFDVVMIHYSLRLCVTSGGYTLSSFYFDAVKKFQGHKVLFIQDEYDFTHLAIESIQQLGINTVFTCVPEPYIEKIYPKHQLPNVEFISILTGYVPECLLTKSLTILPLRDRKSFIAYRGRNLPYWYGQLGQEKEEIGRKMRDILLKKNIAADIEWTEDKRIYGDKWYDFLASAKATLGTESGSNCFDFDGKIKISLQNALEQNPKLRFEEAYDKYIRPYDNFIRMNQISPKVFEAIALRTVLILYEGDYSGVIKPDIHYIPLKKDFSNIDYVIEKLHDDNYLEEMAERAFQDIILSEKYSYKNFIKQIDDYLNQRVTGISNSQSFVTILMPQSLLTTKQSYFCNLRSLPASGVYDFSNSSSKELYVSTKPYWFLGFKSLCKTMIVKLYSYHFVKNKYEFIKKRMPFISRLLVQNFKKLD